ncbi:GntR family transcriptional regulator [Microbacterium mangrovi]|uniref:GntR family transcriptional regulator n=1 Tax=Microbacterium mangrovi TaxID=1348253 RepID=A0A0B2ABL3_9MICO|nr:GntR family transcriptional regulator [Microbacterium mangrovi]KHK99153.1 GntR family transcriptional regulator [Microbacterium mangrovi]
MGTTSADDAYDALREAVLTLDLAPGELLSERGLEDRLGASRTPIRAALLRLSAEGLTRRDGRAWRVSPIDLTEIRAVMEYREIVETAAARLAVERADAADIEALRAVAEASREHDDADAEMLRDGGDFHLALVQLARNPFLANAVRDALTRLLRTRWLEVRTAESRAHARAEHRHIVDAIAARDADRAAGLVAEHSRGTRDRLLAYLEDEHRRLRGRGFAIVESSPEPVRA